MDYFYNVTNLGTRYNNGFDVELESADASLIASITDERDGNSRTSGEANVAIVRFFNDVYLFLSSPQTLTIYFSEPIPTSNLVVQHNPFLVENGDNLYEIQLQQKTHTEAQSFTVLGFATLFAQVDHDGLLVDYKVDAVSTFFTPVLVPTAPNLLDTENMTWAINIVGTYVPPLLGILYSDDHLKLRT